MTIRFDPNGTMFYFILCLAHNERKTAGEERLQMPTWEAVTGPARGWDRSLSGSRLGALSEFFSFFCPVFWPVAEDHRHDIVGFLVQGMAD